MSKKDWKVYQRRYERCIVFRTLSGYDADVTPVPIPNTVVKLRGADDTWRAAAWESRESLG